MYGLCIDWVFVLTLVYLVGSQWHFFFPTKNCFFPISPWKHILWYWPSCFFSNEYPQHMFGCRNKKTIFILTLSMLWANSADAKLMLFFCFFLEHRIWHFMHIVHFMQIVSSVDYLHGVKTYTQIQWKRTTSTILQILIDSQYFQHLITFNELSLTYPQTHYRVTAFHWMQRYGDSNKSTHPKNQNHIS